MEQPCKTFLCYDCSNDNKNQIDKIEEYFSCLCLSNLYVVKMPSLPKLHNTITIQYIEQLICILLLLLSKFYSV
jgi:hypothetical protein